MAHARVFDAIMRAMRIGRFAETRGISTSEAFERVAAARQRRVARRAFLGGLGATAVTTAGLAAYASSNGGPRIAIVGGGFAGLVCADQLAKKGCHATIYEANSRLGGRVHSTHDFPGQVAELGGELIDTPHKTILHYAQALGLAKEDLSHADGEVAYDFFGQGYSETEVVDEYRELVKRMHPDLLQLAAPTFFQHTAAEEALDWTDLATYLDTRAPDLPLIRAVLDVAYNIEYGVETSQQSCLAMLQFIHLDGRRHFAPFGVFSDERYHLVGGNDQLAQAIAAGLPGPIVMGAQLTKLRKNGLGEFELFFNGASSPEIADAVVLAIPFSVLRNVVLEPSLGLSADKQRVIADLPYGKNVKTMIGFDGRPWLDLHGCNGAVYSDRPNLQTSWETNYGSAGPTSVLTDYAGGNRGARLQSGTVQVPLGCGSCHGSGASFFTIDDTVIQGQADAFLSDLDAVLPGLKAAATKLGNKYVVARGHWVAQKYSKGSYTANPPGYFTTMAGLEAQSAGLLKFAGEHTDSFYEWQGFMEGAARSGVAAASELLDDIKNGAL